jgi:integrase
MTKQTTWEGTSVPSLLRNRSSGKFYGRWKLTVNGKSKQKWVNLKTDDFKVAKLRIADEARTIERLRGSRTAVEGGKGTMADLFIISEERTRANSDLKPASVNSRIYASKRVQKTWPALAAMKPSQVTPAAIAEWVARFKKGEGTSFTPNGAKTAIRGNSATSVNHSVDALRRVLDIAVERGAIHTNPARVVPTEGRLKKRITKKKLTLPSFADVQRIFSAIEDNGAVGGWGTEAADFLRFIAFTGCRVAEVDGVTWACVDWKKKLLHLRGIAPANPDHDALKSATSDRLLPLFTELESLLKKVLERRKKSAVVSDGGDPVVEPTDRVFKISECQKSIDAACTRLGIERVTHHDFRHLFATRAIEVGVDFATIARWLGHADGGVLVMTTYGHLRQDHSNAMAAKMNFGTL